MLHEWLGKLNDLIDPELVARAEARTRASLLYESVDRLPTIINCPVPPWPTFSYREGFHDMEKMLMNELAGVWAGANIRDDRMYTIRANYGVGTIASMFGCEILLTQDNGMPWCHPLSEEDLDAVIDSGEIDISAGLGARAAATVRFYREALSGFENLAKHVHIYVCDTQGPLDIAHLMMGHRIYTEIYDNPERVHRLLKLTTKAYISATRAQKALIGEGLDWSYHSQMMSRGGVRVCEDTPTQLSTDSYREFCRPSNEIVLRECGGGWVHYCGDGKQIMEEVLSTPGVKGINFGNPTMQDIGAVYAAARPRKVAVLGWGVLEPLPEGIATGMSVIRNLPDLESAQALLS